MVELLRLVESQSGLSETGLRNVVEGIVPSVTPQPTPPVEAPVTEGVPSGYRITQVGEDFIVVNPQKKVVGTVKDFQEALTIAQQDAKPSPKPAKISPVKKEVGTDVAIPSLEEVRELSTPNLRRIMFDPVSAQIKETVGLSTVTTVSDFQTIADRFVAENNLPPITVKDVARLTGRRLVQEVGGTFAVLEDDSFEIGIPKDAVTDSESERIITFMHELEHHKDLAEGFSPLSESPFDVQGNIQAGHHKNFDLFGADFPHAVLSGRIDIFGRPVTPKPTVKKEVAPKAVVTEPQKATKKVQAKEAEAPAVDVEVNRQLSGLSKMADIWNKKLQSRDQVKASLAKFVRENLPANVRGRYVTAVANVKTDAQLQKQINRVQAFAELNAQKVLKTEIRKEAKKAKAVVKDHVLKGRFTPEVQRRLDVIIRNLDSDRSIARDKMVANIQKSDMGEISYEEMLRTNESLNFAGIEGMSSEELTNTLEYIKILETVGRSERQAKQDVATAKIETIRTDISNILTGGKGLKPGIGAVPRREQEAVTNWLDTFANWQYGIDNIADKLSKLDPTSAPYQSAINQLVSETHRATNREIIGRQEAFDSFIKKVGDVFEVTGTHNTNQALNKLEDEVDLGTFRVTDEYKVKHPDATVVNIKMTRDELVAKYMQMQDPTLNNTFTTGMGWSQQVRDAVVNNLTKQEKELADEMFNFYEDYYQSVNTIYQDLYNIDMPHNPRYSPIRRDFESNVAENILTFQDANQYASVLNASLKARQKNVRPLKFNGATEILSNHIEQMEHFKAWATTIRDLRRVFGNTEIRQAIEQYHGRNITQRIDTFINNMARGGVETAVTNKIADKLRRNFTQAILPIKPAVGLKQLPSTLAYMTEMNISDFSRGVASFWTSPIPNFKFLFNNSEGFRARVKEGNERDIRAALEKHGKARLSGQRSIKDWLFFNIRLPDAVAVSQGMWAKMQAELRTIGVTKETATPEQLEKAINAAEDITGRTQPSFGIDTLSSLQSGGSFMKLLTMFQNQPNKYFRIEADAIRNFKFKRGSRAKNASIILLVHVILPMLFQFIADAFQFKKDRQARAGILGGLNYILIGGQLIQSAWGWLAGDPFDYQVSPVLSTVDEIQRSVVKAKKMVQKGLDPIASITFDDVAALVEHMAKAVGNLKESQRLI